MSTTTTLNPKKNRLERRLRNRLPDMTATHTNPKGQREAILYERPTYSTPARLRNGNGSRYDPNTEALKHETLKRGGAWINT